MVSKRKEILNEADRIRAEGSEEQKKPQSRKELKNKLRE
jgi:hypothetical protein